MSDPVASRGVTRVACPSCGTRLRIAATARRPSLSCPRCLAGFANPLADAPAPSASADGRFRCAWCAEELPGRPGFCPSCGESTRSRPAPPPVEADLRRDKRWVESGLLTLIAVGVLGFGPVLFCLLGASGSEILIFLVPALVCLLIVGAVFSTQKGDPDSEKVARAVANTFAVAGICAAALVVAGIALAVYVLVVCVSRGTY